MKLENVIDLEIGLSMQCMNTALTFIENNKNGTITITVDCPHCDFSCGYAKRLAPRSKVFSSPLEKEKRQ